MGRCKFDGKIIKGYVGADGHIKGIINKVRYSYHIEVAKLFVDNVQKFTRVRHLDGNKLNNKVNDLEWIIKK